VDLTAEYCPARRNLEESGWRLVSQLAGLTSQLPGLVGSNHQAFMAMKDSCKEKREQLTESNRQLHVHLSAHGC
jgi:hypothetical protein